MYRVCCNKDVAEAIFTSASFSLLSFLPQTSFHVDLVAASHRPMPICQLPIAMGCCHGIGSTG